MKPETQEYFLYDRKKSTLSKTEIQNFKAQTENVETTIKNASTRVCKNKTTDQVITEGINHSKNNNFRMPDIDDHVM